MRTPLLALTALVGLWTSSGLAAVRTPMDLNLVLAVDVSESVGEPDPESRIHEYTLMKRGIVAALRDREVAKVLEQCNQNGLGLTYFEWSGTEGKKEIQTVIPWIEIRTGAELSAVASKLESSPRSFPGSGTDLYSAMEYADLQIEQSPFQSYRTRIQISSDGRNNAAYRQNSSGRYDRVNIRALRDRILSKGAAIDALVILNDQTDREIHGGNLEAYYQSQIIGGDRSHVKPVADFSDYANAFRATLLRELMNCQM